MTAAANSAAAAATAVAASPLLAAWTVSLIHDQRDRWWRPRRVSPLRWAVVAAIAALLAATGSRGAPQLAWWLMAVTGTVLAIVDSETHRLPARLVGPLALAELATLTATAVVTNEPQRLARAVLAAGAVASAYFVLALIAPSVMGMGDIYVVGITSGLLGWSSWTHVLAGQALIWLIGPVVMIAIAIADPKCRTIKMHVPMGPALVAGAILASRL